jgi:hypothetical protein
MATLTGSYQYIGRTNAVSCSAGWNYYILLYAKTSGSITTGKHTVTVLMRLACTSDSTFYGYRTDGYVKVGGTNAISWSNAQKPASAWSGSITVGGVYYYRYTDLGEGSVEVNTGWGSAKDVTISTSWGRVESVTTVPTWLPYYKTYATASIAVTLPMIAGATSLNSLTGATQYFDGTMTYKYTPLSSNMYNRCNITHNINGQYIAVRTINLGQKSASQQTATVTLTESELSGIYNGLPNADKGTLRFTFRTYSDSGYSTQIGDPSYKEITLYLPKNTKTLPTPGMTLTPVSSLPSAFAGLYIQGKTKVDANFAGSAKYGASVKSYSVAVEGKSYGSPYTSDYLIQAGSLTVKGTATDSRGFPGTEEKTITVIPYGSPKISVVTCARCDASGKLDDSGTSLKIEASKSYFPVDGKNSCSMWYQWKLSSDSDSGYSDRIPLTTTSDAYNGVISSVVFNNKVSYVVRLGATDTVGETAISTFTIPTEEIFWHRTKNALGLGTYVYREKFFDCAWDARFQEDVTIGDVSLADYIRNIINGGG